MTDEPHSFWKGVERILSAALARAKEEQSANTNDASEPGETDGAEDRSNTMRSGAEGSAEDGNRPPADSSRPESPAPAPIVYHVDHPEKIRAHARLYFGVFVLAVGGCVLWFGSVRRAVNVPEGTVIMLLSAIPFFGAAWHLDRGLKALRDLADSLQRSGRVRGPSK